MHEVIFNETTSEFEVVPVGGGAKVFCTKYTRTTDGYTLDQCATPGQMWIDQPFDPNTAFLPFASDAAAKAHAQTVVQSICDGYNAEVAAA
jgi:hypothetical protein